MKLTELLNQQEMVVLVTSIEEKLASNGKPYVLIGITDGNETVMAKKWDSKIETSNAEVGKLLLATFKVGEYQGKRDYTIINCYVQMETSEYQIKDFVISSPVPSIDMYNYIIKIIENMEHKKLAETVKFLYETNKEQLLSWSAAIGVHHSYIGGLLYHTYRMIQSAIYMTKVYPALNKSILYAGVLLHDIGKLREMNTDPLGNTSFTVEGNLFGHLYIGAEMFTDAARTTGLDKETEFCVKHIILSHHGKKEYGAVEVPSTLEAFVVNYIDLIDSRVEQVERILDTIDPGTFDKNKSYTLEGAHIYHKN